MKKKIIKSNTVKPVYVEHVDNWFLKLDLYYFNEYVFKKHLSTCLRKTGFTVSWKFKSKDKLLGQSSLGQRFKSCRNLNYVKL